MLGTDTFNTVASKACLPLHKCLLQYCCPCHSIVFSGTLCQIAFAIAQELIIYHHSDGITLGVIHLHREGVALLSDNILNESRIDISE